jgi:hypothetical protein
MLSSMAKTFAIIFGIIFVLIGALGFVSNPLVGANALFDTNTAHNLVHLLLGAILLIVAFWTPSQSALWLKIMGVVYLLLALLGFFTSSPLLGLIEVNGADNWLHLVFGAVLIFAGWWAKDDMLMQKSMNVSQGSKPTV